MQRLWIRLCVTSLLLIFLSLPSSADSGQVPPHLSPVYGLAMHGEAKYGPDSVRLDYASAQARKGGTLHLAAFGNFDTLNPYALKGSAAPGLSNFYDRLMGRVWDEPFTLYPLIAERAEIAEDRSAVEIHINPAARFHDGTPITADDVLFSFETFKREGRPNMRRVYGLVTETRKTGPLSVLFRFGAGYDRESVMIIAMMPVLSKAWWSGRDFSATTLDIPPGSGPYHISEISPGRRIVYRRVADYWAENLLVNRNHHNFERIVYDTYRDDSVAFEAFKAGDLDLRDETDLSNWTQGYNFPAMRSGEVRRDVIPHKRPEKVRGFIYNTRRAPFDDIRVREALARALDFSWINENLLAGMTRQVDSFYPNAELAAHGTPSGAETAILAPYRETLPPEVFGPAWTPPKTGTRALMRDHLRRARDLLTEAGWDIQDGTLRHKETGKPFSFEILVGTPDDEKIALSWQRNLKKLGIHALIRTLDSAGFTARLTRYDYDVVLHYWLSTLSPGTEQILYYGCAAADQPGRWNYAGICNPAVDAIALQIADSRDRADLIAHVRALDRILTWGWYLVPLDYLGKSLTAARTSLARPDTTPIYGYVLETWWEKGPEQDRNQEQKQEPTKP